MPAEAGAGESAAFADEVANPYPRPLVAWTAVGVLLVLYALALIDRQIISLIVSPLRAEMGIGDFQIGLLQGFAFALLYSLFGLPVGMAVDRFSRRRVIFWGVLVWALAAAACGLAQNFGQLLAARLFVGAGEAALAPAAYSILSDLFPRKRLTFALGVYSTGASIGAALSFAIGGLVIHWAGAGVMLPILGEVSAWRYAFLVTGIPGLALAFLVFLIPEPVRRTRGRSPDDKSSSGELHRFLRARWKFLACHFIGFGCIMAMAYAKLAWMAPLLERRFHWSIADIGLTLAAINFLNGTIGMPVTGWVVDRMVGRGTVDAHFRFYVYGALVATVLSIASVLMPDPVTMFPLLVLGGIPLAVAGIAAGALQLATPAHLRGRVSAVYLLFTSLFSYSAGPAMVGFFTQFVFADDKLIHLGLAATFLVLGPIAFLAFLLGLGPMRRAMAMAD